LARDSRKGIVHELRRRRVFNTVAIFIVGAWVALQAADLAFPALDIPESAIRFVWMGAFLLFPLVLVFGWLYDITADGIQRTAAVDAQEDADTSLNRIDHGVISTLSSIALAVLIAMGVRIIQVEPDQPVAAVENSIAVMPFEVCEDLARDRNLAGGLTREVINRLAERDRLNVKAYASSYAFAGFGLSRQEIAKPLGVQYLLAGELCRDQGNLSLAAELSDEQGYIVWSDRFAQQVNQFEQISQRLATLVANGVAVELGDVLPATPEAPLNRLAYEELLIGLEHFESGDQVNARTAIERALQHQPDLAEARYYLALFELKSFMSLDKGAGFENARPIVEEALAHAKRRLDQDDRDAQVQYLAGLISTRLTFIDEELLWRGAGDMSEQEIEDQKQELASDFREAERHLRTAITLNPTLMDAYVWLALTLEAQGVSHREEALEILEQGQVLDPFNLDFTALIAKRWTARGRFRQAIELLDRYRDLPQMPSRAWWWQLELMSRQEYFAEKCETLIEMLLHDPGAIDNWGNRWQAWWFVSSLAYLGLFEEAEAWKVRIEDMPMEDWMREMGLNAYHDATGSFVEEDIKQDLAQIEGLSNEELFAADSSKVSHWAIILAESGQNERAIELLETTRHARTLWTEDEAQDTLFLATLYQVVERENEAAPLIAGVVAHLEAEYASGIRHKATLELLAEAYALQGRDDDALDMLRKAVDYHSLTPCSWREEFPASIAHIQQDPRYISLCERIDAERAQQAQRIRDMLSKYDIDDLLAPLIALVDEVETN